MFWMTDTSFAKNSTPVAENANGDLTTYLTAQSVQDNSARKILGYKFASTINTLKTVS